MPPIRRYVRISPHSCLEVRIFVENPTDVSTWLLRPSNPALPRVFSAVKPLILPKLKEENERARLTKGKSGKKKKAVKDVVKGDDFEVVIFLTEGQGRHEVVVKRKEAFDGSYDRIARSAPNGKDDPFVIAEEDNRDEDVNLQDIPMADDNNGNEQELVTTKARRRRTTSDHGYDDDTNTSLDPYQDEKKKLAFKTRYDGFSIWGKILCLLVERKGGPTRNRAPRDTLQPSLISGDAKKVDEGAQQGLMQEWISSTQLPIDDDD